MAQMTYAEQLKHPNWQRRRLERLSVADFTCECCGSKDKTLHVHHPNYRKGAMAWEYEDHELVVYCENCHNMWHEFRAELNADIGAMTSMQLALVCDFARTLLEQNIGVGRGCAKANTVHEWVKSLGEN